MSHRSANLERFTTRSWYYNRPQSVKKYAIMSRTRMCAKPRFRSNTPSRNVLVTDSAICFFLARCRFTHSWCSLHASAWYRLRLNDLMFVHPVSMASGPGSGGVTNAVPGAMVMYTALEKSPLMYLYMPPPLLDGIDV